MLSLIGLCSNPLFTELCASTRFKHAVFKMFGQPVPHLAWVALVGIYSLVDIIAVCLLTQLYGFHIYLRKYTSNTSISSSIGLFHKDIIHVVTIL